MWAVFFSRFVAALSRVLPTASCRILRFFVAMLLLQMRARKSSDRTGRWVLIKVGGAPASKSRTMSALPGAGTLTDHASECAGEMGLIRKSDVDGNLRKLTPAFQEKLLRLGDPCLQ